MICNACRERGKPWDGDDPICGFDKNVFDCENWNCATLGKLRILAEKGKVFNNEQYCSIIPIPETNDFVILLWYKSRGRTDSAIVISDKSILPLTINIAEKIIG